MNYVNSILQNVIKVLILKIYLYNYNLLTKNKQLFLNLRQEYLLEKNFDYIKLIDNKLNKGLESLITKKSKKFTLGCLQMVKFILRIFLPLI